MHVKIFCLGFITVLAIAPTCLAQVPAVPVPAAPANLWTFLLPNAEQCARCRTHLCNSPLGRLLMAAGGPISSMSGGLLGGQCLKNSIAEDIKNKAADEPGGLAARIAADEAEAKERRAAVRLLGTVDCNRWPEAIDVLKNALRKDRNECVRFEAALALRNGCCCNNEIIDALKNCVLGKKKTDPNPVELSDRVRAAAAEALARCPAIHKEPRKGEMLLLKANPIPSTNPKVYYAQLAQMPPDEVAASARAVLMSFQDVGSPPPANTEAANVANVPLAPPTRPNGSNVSDIFAHAFASRASIEPSPPAITNLPQNATRPASTSSQQQPVTDVEPQPTANLPAQTRQPARSTGRPINNLDVRNGRPGLD